MRRLVIYGAGGFGREIAAVALRQSRHFVFVDDREQPAIWGVPVKSADSIVRDDEVCIAIGSSEIRQIIASRLGGVAYATVIAPTAIIGPDVEIGAGATICDGAMITATCRIGRDFQCNINSYVAHDCIVGDNVTLAPRVGLNGNIIVGDGVFIGSGAVIRQGLIIGEGATVGMGAVVTKDVAPHTTVVGNPAHTIQRQKLRVA